MVLKYEINRELIERDNDYICQYQILDGDVIKGAFQTTIPKGKNEVSMKAYVIALAEEKIVQLEAVKPKLKKYSLSADSIFKDKEDMAKSIEV